jgi:response regulator RpfG family c-di-GMP phosphodiesterase
VADPISVGAAVHDIGKVAVPRSVLAKPGSPAPWERAVVQRHCSVRVPRTESSDQASRQFDPLCAHAGFSVTGTLVAAARS